MRAEGPGVLPAKGNALVIGSPRSGHPGFRSTVPIPPPKGSHNTLSSHCGFGLLPGALCARPASTVGPPRSHTRRIVYAALRAPRVVKEAPRPASVNVTEAIDGDHGARLRVTWRETGCKSPDCRQRFSVENSLKQQLSSIALLCHSRFCGVSEARVGEWLEVDLVARLTAMTAVECHSGILTVQDQAQHVNVLIRHLGTKVDGF